MRFIDFTPGGSAHELTINTTSAPKPARGQALIKVAAFGINRADLLQRKGQYPPPPGESDILGLEVAGEVVELGEGGEVSAIKPGMRVCGLVAGGGYAEYAVVDCAQLIPLADNLTDEQGAAIAECYLTAYQSLFVEYALQPGQTVLIHAGASGVGLAAIQLAKQRGCTVAVTSSSAEKLAICQANGADHLVNYRQQDFAEVLRSLGVKCHLIVDFVGGDYVNRNVASLERDGVIIQLATLAGRYVEKLDLGMMLAKRAVLKASTLRNRSADYKAKLVAAFCQDFYAALASSAIQPVIDSVYSVDNIAAAHARMESSQNSGKLVVHW